MIQIHALLCMLLVSAKARDLDEAESTNVISLISCKSGLPTEEKIGKRSLDEVQTYAELKGDPGGSLPDSFTVCSAIMTSSLATPCPLHRLKTT